MRELLFFSLIPYLSHQQVLFLCCEPSGTKTVAENPMFSDTHNITFPMAVEHLPKSGIL